jgi:hypothetical protein
LDLCSDIDGERNVLTGKISSQKRLDMKRQISYTLLVPKRSKGKLNEKSVHCGELNKEQLRGSYSFYAPHYLSADL